MYSHIDYMSKSPVTWVGPQINKINKNNLSHLKSENTYFYRRCIFGPLTIKVGDFVLISNADSADPDSVNGCDIARILYLYELDDKFTKKDRCRAVVQWYSRPECIPHKHFDDNNICIDFQNEVIEEWRPYDNDVSIESIFNKCSVIMADVNQNASVLKNNKKRNYLTTFVCRYKFCKKPNRYHLLPLNYQNDDIKTRTPKSTKKTLEDIEFIDVKNTPNGLVSPIKIIGNCVVKLSKSSSKKIDNLMDINMNSTPVDLNHKITGVRRNLNISMEAESSDMLNYSIMENTPDNPNNDMRIKLKISSSQKPQTTTPSTAKSISRLSINSSIKHISENVIAEKRRCNQNISTPLKKSNEINVVETTPITRRRKSILKTPGGTNTKETPKKTLQLSNIVEERIFKKTDLISSPATSKDYLPQTPRSRKRTSHTANVMTPNESTAPVTPSQKMKLIRSGAITPSINKREKYSVGAKVRKSDLQMAREQLHVSAIPQSLPCRETEFENIYSFLEDKILDQSGGCMYISGVPGTGKTATTTEVVRCLKYKAEKEELPAFQFIEINGMRLTEPKQAYVQIYKQLTGKTVSCDQAYTLLEKRFTTSAPRRTTTVLLVDELDILCNRRQDVVYNLLDWPSKLAARLVVITIANTMDLPERLLMGKVTSRLGLTRLTFQPYTHKQLQEIVMSRLSGSDAFKSDAVQLVARKVAAVSGDARRALDICRRATEIAEDNNTEKIKTVNMLHVQKALEEMIASAKVQAIKNCSRLEQVFLQAVAAEVSRTGVEETNFHGVYLQIQSIAPFIGVVIPSPGKAMKICAKLGNERLLICEHSRADIFQKILLNVSVDDIHYALQVKID